MDLVIRGADIYDGRGGSPYKGDVGVSDGRIAAVGVVDAKGADALKVQLIIESIIQSWETGQVVKVPAK